MAVFKKYILSHACLSFFFGIIGVFAFAPFHLYPLIIISLTGLLWIFTQSTQRQAFRCGFSYGIGFFGAGVYWVYISLHAFGDASAIVSILMTICFIAVLALFPACLGTVLNRYFPENSLVKYWLAFPAIWTLSEWIRTWAFSGFPWLLAGSSQTVWPLKGIAAIGGVYLVSFFLAHIAGGLAYCCSMRSFLRINALAYLVCLLSVCGFVSLHQWTHPNGTPIRVSLVQGNILPSLKWQPEEAERHYQKYLALSQAYWKNSLLIWPEAAIPTPFLEAGPQLHQLEKISQQNHAGFIAGIPYQTTDLTSDYNAAISLGEAKGLYFKRHLVPFGEYFPVQNISKILLSWLDIPMSDFRSGPHLQAPIDYQHVLLTTFICYEIIFSEEVRQALAKSGVILLLSDDAWFGRSLAQAQHIQMAQMRAIETGRYVLNVTNNGITAIINPQGKIVKSLAPYQSAVLTGEIVSYQGNTPWLRFGSNIYLLICILSLIIAKIAVRRWPNIGVS